MLKTKDRVLIYLFILFSIHFSVAFKPFSLLLTFKKDRVIKCNKIFNVKFDKIYYFIKFY